MRVCLCSRNSRIMEGTATAHHCMLEHRPGRLGEGKGLATVHTVVAELGLNLVTASWFL